MMGQHDLLVEHIAQTYQISPIQAITLVTAGFLSKNYRLETASATYFLKQYRYTKRQFVSAVHEAKFFFATAQVPVILPLMDQQGATFFTYEDNYYSLFPFIKGQHLRRGAFSLRALASAANMLAHIHRVGRQVTIPHIRKTETTRNYPAFVETAQQMLSKIPQHEQTRFDQLATACIQLKLRLGEQQQAEFGAIALASDHLIHGDYQDANLFFDQDEQVSHVFDWEKAEIAPRGLELVRAIEFICLSNPHDYKAVFTDDTYAKARHFLQSYHQLYPITRREFAAAAKVRYLHKIVSLWVEADHYLENGRRVDLFLEAEYNAVSYYAHHLNDHIERLCSSILV